MYIANIYSGDWGSTAQNKKALQMNTPPTQTPTEVLFLRA